MSDNSFRSNCQGKVFDNEGMPPGTHLGSIDKYVHDCLRSAAQGSALIEEVDEKYPQSARSSTQYCLEFSRTGLAAFPSTSNLACARMHRKWILVPADGSAFISSHFQKPH